MKFSDKYQAEKIKLGFDLKNRLATGETILGCSFSISCIAGVDTSPSSMLVSSGLIDGTKITQMVQGGVVGGSYILQGTVTTSGGRVLTNRAEFAVR